MKNEIHVTDCQSYCRCRRAWDWSSLLRRGLQPALPPEPLFLGQGIHVALDRYYQLMHTERSIELIQSHFTTWIESRAIAIARYKGSLWEADRELLRGTRHLGEGMLAHYHLWVHQRDSNFEIVDTEVKFEIPLDTNPKTTLAGRFDGIFRDKETDKLYVMEFKTARSLSNSSWSLRSIQGSVYTIAAKMLYGENVDGIIYRVLRKKRPSDPKPLKRGGFSQAKNQDTSYEWFLHRFRMYASEVEHFDTPHDFVLLSDLQARYNRLLASNTKILNHLQSTDNKFFLERKLRKTKQQLENARLAILSLASEMVSDPEIFAMPGLHCAWCGFREPCDLMEYGMERDAEAVLEVEYAKRDYWEDEKDD